MLGIANFLNDLGRDVNRPAVLAVFFQVLRCFVNRALLFPAICESPNLCPGLFTEFGQLCVATIDQSCPASLMDFVGTAGREFSS